MIRKILVSVLTLTAIGGVIYFIWSLPEPVGAQYMKQIEVDSSEKIEWALSNAVHDVESHDFVVTAISVNYWPLKKSFIIRCGGRSHTDILILGD